MVNVAGVALVVAGPDSVVAVAERRLLLRNAGCCCGAGTRGHGGAAERDVVASMEVGRGYGSLQVADSDICRSGSLMARKMVVAAASRRRRVTEHYGSGSFRTEA